MSKKKKEEIQEEVESVDKSSTEQTKEPTEENISELKERLDFETSKKLEILADFKNYKQRVEREREDLVLLGNKVLLNIVLEIRDDLNRALEEIENPTGLVMISDKIANLLKEQNIEEVEVKKGDSFNSEVMEAIGTINVENPAEDGKVMHIERLGYRVGGRDQMLRTARVIVGKKA